MKSNKKPGTSWKKRLGGAAAGVCVAAVVATGLGLSSGGANAATATKTPTTVVVTKAPTGGMSMMSTGWGG
jgi:hypothetical protein